MQKLTLEKELDVDKWPVTALSSRYQAEVTTRKDWKPIHYHRLRETPTAVDLVKTNVVLYICRDTLVGSIGQLAPAAMAE